jgi:hypothetical protein
VNRWLACMLTSLRQQTLEGLSFTEVKATDLPERRPPEPVAPS